MRVSGRPSTVREIARPLLLPVLLLAAGRPLAAEESARRLYDGVTAFVHSPEGKAFTVTLEVRDLNHRMHGPSELLVKVYPPDGRPVVREVIPDDGVLTRSAGAYGAGWDHEAWYYATAYSRGLRPLVRWSAFSDPQRLANMPTRRFSYQVAGGQKGVYRVLVVGAPDHYVTLKLDPPLKYGVAGSPEWLHGHHDLHRRSFIYVPKTTRSINVHFLQLDEPAERTFAVKDPSGAVVASGSGGDGLVQTVIEDAGRFGEQALTLEVSDGPGDYLINVTHQLENELKPVRAKFQAVTAVLSPDAETARATQGGAIYHDDRVFWQMSQVRLYDWLKKLKPEEFEYPAELDERPGFVSVGSHNSPKKGSADRIMHAWADHKNPRALNAALQDMLFGLRLMGHGDHVAIGPNRNLAYEMGCYTFFWYRPAWRIIQQSNAADEVKAILRELVIMAGDRLAFCRTVATGNGNAFASLMAGVAYCLAASQDPLHKQLFDTIWQRFTTGGYGDRVGLGPSGGLQESLGYDYHYGSYVLRGWRAINQDLKDPRIVAAYERILNLYSFVHFRGPAGNPWSSRTSIPKPAGGTYDAWDQRFRWKGFGGRDFVTGVNGHNEWFAARRPSYYMVTYHGRLTPTWMGEGFHGQIGFGGGTICFLEVIGKGQVISAKPNSSYGGGMHLSQWPSFHVHGIVGYTADGQPLVAANSEHFNARQEGNRVVSSGPVRESSVRVERRYLYGSTAITCEASLSESVHDNVFGLWGGRPALRGKVTEAWEMIPFVDAPKRKGKPRSQRNRTRVALLGTNGEPIAELTDASVGKVPVEAAGALIELKGYGALIQFDQVRRVKRGGNDTLLVQLAASRVPASQVRIRYVIVPFVGDPPKLGALAGAGKKPHLMPRVATIERVDEVAGVLAEAEPVEIKAGDTALARVRFAFAGDDLAIHAEVTDATLLHHREPWRGSCVEVFGAMPETLEIGQVFLAPQVADRSSGGYLAKGLKQVPEGRIRTQSKRTELGYEIQALIPLSLLKVKPEAKKFLLEIQVSSSKGKKRIYANLFGSERAYENCSKYGLFVFELPEDGAGSSAQAEGVRGHPRPKAEPNQ